MFRVSNHPVHIVDGNGKLSPSSFIPFCLFGGDKNLVGLKDIQFSNVTTICKSFQGKILNDQLCYEMELDNYYNRRNIDRQLKSGFVFFMDYNEDRQINFEDESPKTEDGSYISRIVDTNDNQHAFIYLDTLGRFLHLRKKLYRY